MNSVIQLNDEMQVDLLKMSTGDIVAVVDDFLLEPEKLKEHAVEHSADFYMPPKSYPGVVLDIDADPMQDIYRFIRSTLGKAFSFYRGDARFSSMLSMTTVQPDELSSLQRLCHSDPPAERGRRNFAFVLYLFDNEGLGGTGFYRWKEKEAIIAEGTEKVLHIGDQYAKGLITEEERYSHAIKIWAQAKADLSSAMIKNYKKTIRKK